MTQLKLSASIGVLLLVGVIAVFGGVKAYQSYGVAPKVVIENGNYIEAQSEDQKMGAMSSPDSPYNWESVGGDVTYHMGGPLMNATTTIVSFENPFGTSATSTVDLVRIDVLTAATSTYSLSCGAAATAYSADTVSLLDTAANGVTTSTVGILENNLTAALGGIADAGTVEKITLTPSYPYFTCTVTSVYPGAFTEVTNTFDGRYTVHVHKQQ